MTVVDGSFDTPLSREEHASMPMAGGIMGMGFQCGQLWGAALAAGARAYHLYGPGPQAEAAAVSAAQRLAESFRASYRSINCSDVTQMEWKNAKTRQILGYFLKGGPIKCFSMTADYARAAFSEINAVFSDGHLAPAPLVSCAAALARKMGASDLHATMAAGLAGGIGLSGGACGALGAAIWIRRMNSDRTGFDLNDPEILDLIDRFVESTDIQFDCSEIVGRKFQDIGDHAGYIRDGGCARLIEALASG
jgi:hypothetical protein